ncbi:hypothetical protein AB0H03_06785 [Streptomyces sparsogenes]|uniref:hypothetical protein n=1 Tax=Streptomyces sparsogenes TaxID=67365 RepID=UPI0033C2CE55
MRVYATPAELATYTGQAAPADAERLLARASRMLEAEILRYCRYDVDATTGMPTNELVLAAIRDAVCAQVQWWGELGDSIGAVGAGWGSVSIGSVSLSGAASKPGGSAPAARQVAPQAVDALRSPDLTPDIWAMGEVCSW